MKPALLLPFLLLLGCSSCARLAEMVDQRALSASDSIAEREVLSTVEIAVTCRPHVDPRIQLLIELGAQMGEDPGSDEDGSAAPKGSDEDGSAAAPKGSDTAEPEDEDDGLEHDEGTGILVGPDRVLTNKHVIDCVDEDSGETGDVVEIKVRMAKPGSSEAWLPAQTEVVLPERDVARLRIVPDDPMQVVDLNNIDKSFEPIQIGPTPKVGDHVCFSSAVPRPSYKCGLVQPLPGVPNDFPVAPGAEPILVDVYVEFGNSGSPVVDVFGRLVGLATAATRCQDERYCLGWVTPIAGAEFVVTGF